MNKIFAALIFLSTANASARPGVDFCPRVLPGTYTCNEGGWDSFKNQENLLCQNLKDGLLTEEEFNAEIERLLASYGCVAVNQAPVTPFSNDNAAF